MTPFYDDGQATFYHGDVRDCLRGVPAGSAQMCVTSPPYWGLRDYGTATWDGGDAECEHKPLAAPRSSRPQGALGGSTATVDAGTVQRDCHCGARRIDQQLGLEATPEAYVAAMVDVFREVKRVLTDDGTLWLNIGDSYASTTKGGGGAPSETLGSKNGVLRTQDARERIVGPKRYSTVTLAPGCKPKDLVGIPWMLAFALRADGWYLRQDIIWAKPNPMPESVTDRCTKSHEYLFLLSKSARYYYDADAIREAHSRDWWNETPSYPGNPDRNDGGGRQGSNESAGRNKRSVWTIATQPYPEAHFATFPEDLVKPCILAGSREGDTVLDPFLGSGTTAMVAKALGRRAIGIDLSADYLALAVKRNQQMGLMSR